MNSEIARLEEVRDLFEQRLGIDGTARERIFGDALAGRDGWADLFLEHTVREIVSLEDGEVRKASRHVESGAGVRVISGERTGYTYTTPIRSIHAQYSTNIFTIYRNRNIISVRFTNNCGLINL